MHKQYSIAVEDCNHGPRKTPCPHCGHRDPEYEGYPDHSPLDSLVYHGLKNMKHDEDCSGTTDPLSPFCTCGRHNSARRIIEAGHARHAARVEELRQQRKE